MVSRVDTLARELEEDLSNTDAISYLYTYPPRKSFRSLTEDFTHEAAWQDVDDINVYIHIPFCPVRCQFCCLFTIPVSASGNQDLVDRYTEAVVREIASYQNILGHAHVKSIYFGGGTPTYLSIAQFGRIFEQLQHTFLRIDPEIERSVEVYPDVATEPGKLQGLKALGISRLSVGVQTLDPTLLRATGRPYPAELGLDMVRDCLNMGFDNINVDLIYGLPNQTLSGWERDLDRLARERPETITCYPLEFPRETAYTAQRRRNSSRFPAEETKAEWYDLSRAILESRGYVQETTVRFVLPGGGYRQETLELSGTPTVGFGASACSSAPSVHYRTDYAVMFQPSMGIIQSYIDAIEHDRISASYGFVLDDDEAKRRYVICHLQLKEGLSKRDFRLAFGVSLRSEFGDELDALSRHGCIASVGDDIIVLTERGRRYSKVSMRLLFSRRVKELEETGT